MRDEQINDFYLPLTSTVVLQLRQENLYAPLDFKINPTVVALVDSRAYVSAIGQNDLDTIKQKAPHNVPKTDDPPNFLTQVANGQFEKPSSTTTLKFEIGDNVFAEHFVVMKKLTGSIIGLSSRVVSTSGGGGVEDPMY